MSKDNSIAKELVELSPHESTFYGFASFIEGRTNGTGWNHGEYKRHKTMAHAKSAVANSSYMRKPWRLYQWSAEARAWVQVEAGK